MAHVLEEISRVSDAELVRGLERLVKADRELIAKLLAHLGEVHERKLFLARGYSSMFEYCRSALGMSEAEAYLRMHAASVGRRFPLVLERLGAGDVHLTAIKLLAPLFTEENHAQLLGRARGMSKRKLEALVAELAPKPDMPERLRKLPSPQAPIKGSLFAPQAAPAAAVTLAAACSSTVVLQSGQTSVTLGAPASSSFARQLPPGLASQSAAGGPVATFALQPPRGRASTAPLSPGRFKLELTLGQDAHDKLKQLRELLRHQNPSGDLASIVERALRELLERTMKRRFAQKSTPKQSVACAHARPTRDVQAESDSPERSHPTPAVNGSRKGKGSPRSRYIPREVLREVHARDGGQCTFVSAEGRRCHAREFLEVHHHNTTFARGGAATADNLRLTCRAHNLFFAEQDYGRRFMLNARRMAQRARSGNESNLIACAPLRSTHAYGDAEERATR